MGVLDIKKVGCLCWNFLLYFFVFLLIFFVIYRAYIFRFGLKPLPCMNDICIRERKKM